MVESDVCSLGDCQTCIKSRVPHSFLTRNTTSATIRRHPMEKSTCIAPPRRDAHAAELLSAVKLLQSRKPWHNINCRQNCCPMRPRRPLVLLPEGAASRRKAAKLCPTLCASGRRGSAPRGEYHWNAQFIALVQSPSLYTRKGPVR